MMSWRTLALVSLLVAAAGCNGDKPPNPVQKGDGAGGDADCPPPCSVDGTPPSPWDTLTWEIQEVDIGTPTMTAGIQNRMIRKPNGDIYIAYFKRREPMPSCDIAAFGGGPAPVPHYELRIARLPNGASDWIIDVVTLDHLDEPGFATATYGIDATLNASGQVVVVLAAGGVSLFQCGSTDVVTCTEQGASWNCQADVIDSSACCPERDTCVLPGLQCCDAMQNACRTGSTLGAWAAIARSGSGTLGITYVDTHNAAVQDAQDYQGLEIYEGSGSTGIRPWSGEGKYTDITYVGDVPVVAFTHFHRGGLSILRRPAVTSTGNDWLDPDPASRLDAWDGYEIGERIRLEKTPDGSQLGLLFHAYRDRNDTIVNDLVYCRSSDGGETWDFPCSKLVTGHLGGFPSLAYDNDNIPYVAYQECGSVDCPPTQDGLRFAWYDDSQTYGKWWQFIVHRQFSSRSGIYNQIVVDPDTKEPTIAFQVLSESSSSLVVARGHLD